MELKSRTKIYKIKNKVNNDKVNKGNNNGNNILLDLRNEFNKVNINKSHTDRLNNYLYYNFYTDLYIYKSLYTKYDIKIPVFTILDWYNIYETLYKCKVSNYPDKSTFIHLCSNEESSGYALDFYFYNMYKKEKLINNISLNINNKLNTLNKKKFKKNNTVDMIIYNCSLDYNLEKDKYLLNFIYYLNIKDCNLHSVQFNYINSETNIKFYILITNHLNFLTK